MPFTVIDGKHRTTFSDLETAKAFARERAAMPTWSGNVRVDDGWNNLYEIYLNLRPGGSGVLVAEGAEVSVYDGPTYPGKKVAAE